MRSFSLINRGKLNQPVREEFEHLIGQVRGFVTSITDDEGDLLLPAPVTLAAVPVGTMLLFAGTMPPAGYLLCDGRAVSRATYAALFAVIGPGNAPDDSSFVLPDMQQHSPSPASRYLIFAGLTAEARERIARQRRGL